MLPWRRSPPLRRTGLEQVLAERETDWLGRYGERVDSWHGLPDGQDRDSWLCQVGEDGFHLLMAVRKPKAPDWLRRIPAPDILRQVWVQQYHRGPDGVRVREGEDLPPAHRMLVSPYDTEARYGTKKTTSWTGDWLHLTETCDDEAPRLITDAATAAERGQRGRVRHPYRLEGKISNEVLREEDCTSPARAANHDRRFAGRPRCWPGPRKPPGSGPPSAACGPRCRNTTTTYRDRGAGFTR